MTNELRLRRWTGAARKALPPRAVAAVRKVMLRWGQATARFRMKPVFIVVGAQRSGTTTLYRLLEAHPNLIRPTLSKGTGFFDDNYSEGLRWYTAHFPLRSLARLRSGSQQPVHTFELSGYYLLHPLSAERIARELPDVKIVVVVRDPVERAYSAHAHERARGFETEDFERAVQLEPQRTEGERERLMTIPQYTSFTHRHHSYLARGRYAEQIHGMIDAVGRDRVYIMEADRFFAEPAVEFERLQVWLGLPLWHPPRIDQWNQRPREMMSDEIRDRLRDYFEPFDDDLVPLLGHPPIWRASDAQAQSPAPSTMTPHSEQEQDGTD